MDTNELVEAIQSAENAHDWERLGSLFADDVTVVHPGLGPLVGREANIGFIRFFSNAISGYTRTIERLVTDGRSGAFCFTISGTHTGDLPGFPATGEPVDIGGAMFFEVAEGRVTHAIEILNRDSIRNIDAR